MIAPRWRCPGTGLSLLLISAAHGCTLETDLGHWAAPGSDEPPNADEPVDAATSAREDAGTSDAGSSDAGCSSSACTPVASSLVLTVTAGPGTSYFADGKTLPAGDYTLSYVDGCWHSGVVAWTVNLGGEGYALVGGQPEHMIVMAPGTVGTFAGGLGAYFTYDECVAANVGRPSVSFHFEGGQLGLQLESLTPITTFINVEGGEAAGGVSPTFRLTCTGVCR